MVQLWIYKAIVGFLNPLRAAYYNYIYNNALYFFRESIRNYLLLHNYKKLFSFGKIELSGRVPVFFLSDQLG